MQGEESKAGKSPLFSHGESEHQSHVHGGFFFYKLAVQKALYYPENKQGSKETFLSVSPSASLPVDLSLYITAHQHRHR